MNGSDSETEPGMPGEPAVLPGYGVARVVVKRSKKKPFIGRHPWVFRTAIERVEGNVRNGDIVDLVSDNERFIARGIINRNSQLTVRLYSWQGDRPLDDSFWREQIAGAVQLRRDIGYDATSGAARLVFGEADGLSGLVVDRYLDHLVLQVNSLATAAYLPEIADALRQEVRPRSLIIRSEANVAKLEGVNPVQGLLWGSAADGPIIVEEHGLRYGVDLLTGQKTGFYLDQRENRKVAASYLGGRRVLDVFCYTGGFSLAASKLGGASEVLGIDTSDKAIVMARANAELNGLNNVHFRQQDGFDALHALQQQGQKFDAVILDPPKFTRTRQSLKTALQAYHRINRLAVELLNPGGILITCSCSGNVGREDFLMMLSGVVEKTKRSLRVLEQRGPSPDHPVSPTCLDSEYLKCFICRVD